MNYALQRQKPPIQALLRIRTSERNHNRQQIAAKQNIIASDTILSGIVVWDKYTITFQMETGFEISYYVYRLSIYKN